MATDPTRTYGRRILSTPTQIQLFVGFAVLTIVTAFSVAKSELHDLVMIWITASALLGFLAYIDLGHRLSWDDERIWMQFDGMWRIFRKPPETSIRIADIEWIEGEYVGDDSTFKRSLMPFDQMTIHGETTGEEPNVLIVPHYVHVNSVRELLHHIDYRKPGVLAPEVVAFMHSDKGF
jgi:hypothetical protein